MNVMTVVIIACSGDILKKSSENDRLTGHFQSFFFVPDPKSVKKIP